MKNIIHQTPEERLANTSQHTATTLQDTNSKLDKLHAAATDKSLETAGFSGVAKKIDEVKSAALITNKLLKDISMKEPPAKVQMELTNKPNDLATAFFSMLKGEKGETPTPQEITKLIKPLIPKPIKGDPGAKGDAYILTDEDKQVIANTISVPVVEKVIERTEVIKEQPMITHEIKEVAVADTPNTIVEKIHQAEKLIHPSRVVGLEQALREVDNYGKNPMGIGGGANATIVQDEGTKLTDYFTTLNFVGAGVTASYLGNGIIAVTIPGGSGVVYSETPSGTINSSNVTFTVLHTINTVFSFALNGQYLHPTTDYTTSGSTITFVVAPDTTLSGLPFTIVYG